MISGASPIFSPYYNEILDAQNENNPFYDGNLWNNNCMYPYYCNCQYCQCSYHNQRQIVYPPNQMYLNQYPHPLSYYYSHHMQPPQPTPTQPTPQPAPVKFRGPVNPRFSGPFNPRLRPPLIPKRSTQVYNGNFF